MYHCVTYAALRWMKTYSQPFATRTPVVGSLSDARVGRSYKHPRKINRWPFITRFVLYVRYDCVGGSIIRRRTIFGRTPLVYGCLHARARPAAAMVPQLGIRSVLLPRRCVCVWGGGDSRTKISVNLTHFFFFYQLFIHSHNIMQM